MVVWYYNFSKIICYVEQITKIIWIYKTLLYSKVVDFEISDNFCVDPFLFEDVSVSKLLVQRVTCNRLCKQIAKAFWILKFTL